MRSGTVILTALAIMILVSSSMIVLADDADATNASGTSGNITWTLADGTLTLTGTGAMSTYSGSNQPWYEYRTEISSVVIGQGITSIGAFSFYGCSSLTSVTIPSGVTSIGGSAFALCTTLTSVTIPSGVTSIENYAFYGCSSLTSVNIPSGVTSIKSNLFCNCMALTSVTIPDGVTSIESNAFRTCESLPSIRIPDSVTSIASYAFLGCSVLTSVYATATVYAMYAWPASVVRYDPTVNVTFKPNNGANQTVVVNPANSTISVWPSDPAKDGYVFTGWYVDSACTSLYDISAPVTVDITLYAGYEISLVFETEPSAVANVTVSASFDNAISCSAADSQNYSSVVWDFGDGTTSTAVYCIHMYASPGTYTVTLTAVNDYGSDVTASDVTVHTLASAVDEDGDGSSAGIPLYVWLILAVIVGLIIILVARFL